MKKRAFRRGKAAPHIGAGKAAENRRAHITAAKPLRNDVIGLAPSFSVR